jgi:hypothetical protein
LPGWDNASKATAMATLSCPPPPGNRDSFKQTEILITLLSLLPHGKAHVEVPISTSDGIRAADVAWTSDERFAEIYDPRAYLAPPRSVHRDGLAKQFRT